MTRIRDERDERQVRIALSRDGRNLKRKAVTIPSQVQCATGKSRDALLGLRAQLMQVRRDLLES